MNAISENKSDYYTKKTTLELLKVSENILKKLVVEFNIQTITGNYTKGDSNSYLKETIDNIIELQKKEVDMYISAAHATEKYGSYITYQANKISTPSYLKFEGGINSSYMYIESEILQICEKLHYKLDETGRLVKKDWTEVLDPSQYCTLEDALELLNMDLGMFNKLKKHYGIDNFMIKSLSNHSFYKKADIEHFLKLREEDKKIYMQNADATKKYSSSFIRQMDKSKKIMTPLYMAERGCIISKYSYRISDLEEFREYKNLEFIDEQPVETSGRNLKLKDGHKRVYPKKPKPPKKVKPLFSTPAPKSESALFYEKYADNPTQMFLELCKLKGFDLDILEKELPYTIYYWREFIINRISDFSGAPNRYKSVIGQLFNATKVLLNTISDDGYHEIYTLTTKEIWSRLKGSSLRHRIVIILFLKEVHSKILKEISGSDAINKELFSVIELEKLHKDKVKKDKNKKEKEKKLNNKNKDNKDNKDIYSIDTFLEMLNYTANIDKHLERSIEEYETLNLCTYASTWLNVLIHLNNGWRLNDASNFKRIEISNILSQIGINNIDWFKNNKLSLLDAKLIISRVSQKEFIMTKTRMKGHYFCSDDLACPVATAIIFLTLTCKKTIDNQLVLTDFDNILNTPTEFQFSRFFNDFKVLDFKFTSRKMNKTLLTYIFTINGGLKNDTALAIASKMRGHVTEDMILHYVKMDGEEMSKISKILFDRGEFGFIHELLINGSEESSGTSLNREEKNEIVQNIKNKLCNVYNIEFLAGFLNDYNLEKSQVIDEIKGKTLEERRKKLTDIYAKNLLSKESGIHCFLGIDNCPTLKNGKPRECNKCAYHIPTLTAIKDISLDFYKNILEYHKAKSPAKKLKLSALLNHNLEVFSSAIETYGYELVYSFMEHEIHEVEDLYNEILEPDFIYKKYLLGGN